VARTNQRQSRVGSGRTAKKRVDARALGAVSEQISARWIASALVVAVAAAGLCLWGALCLIFWLGSWQLLYHPTANLATSPASVGLDFVAVDFATTESGQPQLHGWWIPSSSASPITAIYLHGATGNMGDALLDLRPLHDAKMNVLVFDYRGYGTSRFERPSEAHWREDAESAIQYLTMTRHISATDIVLAGSGLGANLALETGATHPELAGVVMDEPLASPEDIVFSDPRARLVPARWLVADRWDLAGASAELRIASIWFAASMSRDSVSGMVADAYGNLHARKARVWVKQGVDRAALYRDAIERWTGDLERSGAKQ
jgi:pimeloyl-ACP methyl ester carboxylesterase